MSDFIKYRELDSFLAVQGRFKRNRRKPFGGCGENEIRKKKVRNNKEEM